MSSFFKDVATVVVGRSFIRASQFVSFILLARFLSVEEFGWFGLITSAITMAVMLGSLGLRQSIAYHVGHDLINLRQSMGAIVSVFPLLAAISSLIVIALYFQSAPVADGAIVSFAIASAVSFALLIALLQGISLATGDIKSFSWSETSPRVVLAALVTAMVVVGMASLEAALVSYAVGFLLVGPWLFFKSKNIAGGFSPPHWRQLLQLVRFGLGFAINLFLVFGISRTGIFILEKYHDAEAAGLLFAAVRVNEILLEIAAAIGIVVFSNAVQKGVSNEDFISRTSRLACLVFWVFSALGIVIALFGTHLVTLIAGVKYADSGSALSILAMSLGVASANKVIYPAVAGRGRPLFGTPAIIVGIAFSSVVALLVVPETGLTGAAIAIASGQLVIFLAYVLSFRIAYKTPILKFFVPRQEDLRELAGAVKRKVRRLK